ncbi:hypothetical protein Pint_07333 [Pistacia integerrima]|uniref:Uncharacterized protein n=1 Tax=Pistacia integerrima TaxID=434235 RepID=A0ACC0XWH7_9ROSI|nr:hypothetical protein Pint_07333 [Pistacia integerrima]
MHVEDTSEQRGQLSRFLRVDSIGLHSLKTHIVFAKHVIDVNARVI